jgi:hypothetical protein
MAGLCPKCDAPLTYVKLNDIKIKAPGQDWVGASYSCPFCLHIVSVGIDPIAIKTDIVDEIVRQLRNG